MNHAKMVLDPELHLILTVAAQVQPEDTLKCCRNEWEGVGEERDLFPSSFAGSA